MMDGGPIMTGKATPDQQQRIINKQENTKAPLTDETLKHAKTRYPAPGPRQ
jgi:hypothetical protein